MVHLSALLLILLAAPVDQEKPAKKTPPAARVTITAELACLHCTFGEGDSCAVCLKLDDKTPVVLAGKVAKQLEDERFSKKVVVVEGALAIKDKRLVLTSDSAHVYSDKDKGKAPEKGQAVAVGVPCCGHCDLGLCDECTLAVTNAGFPVILDGKLALQHADEAKEGKALTAGGKLYIDKRGLLRLDAKKIDFEKKK